VHATDRTGHLVWIDAMPYRTYCFALLILFSLLLCVTPAKAYEVAVGLGSTAGKDATIAMMDRSKWPMVADQSWGPLANLYPIALLNRAQQEAIFNNFRHQRAIAEVPYESINWTGDTQPDISFIESFGFTVPYLFSINEQHQDGMLTRSEIIRLKKRFPDKKIIMIARSWERDQDHVRSVQDVVDGVCIEYIPHNLPINITKHVAPFAEWAYHQNKTLIFLMPPLPDDYLEDRFVRYVKALARTVYEANKNKLPTGWMKSDKFIFAPANYTFGTSKLPYVTENAKNSVLAAAKGLLLMRPQLDAEPDKENAGKGWLSAVMILLKSKVAPGTPPTTW